MIHWSGARASRNDVANSDAASHLGRRPRRSACRSPGDSTRLSPRCGFLGQELGAGWMEKKLSPWPTSAAASAAVTRIGSPYGLGTPTATGDHRSRGCPPMAATTTTFRGHWRVDRGSAREPGRGRGSLDTPRRCTPRSRVPPANTARPSPSPVGANEVDAPDAAPERTGSASSGPTDACIRSDPAVDTAAGFRLPHPAVGSGVPYVSS